MNVTDRDGNPVTTATLGDLLKAVIRKKQQDTIYVATLPTYCYFSDWIGGSGTPTTRIPFVIESCPNLGLISSFPYIDEVVRENETYYEVLFQAFTFSGYSMGELGITCELLLCINISLCHKPCWVTSLLGSSPTCDSGSVESAGNILTRKKFSLLILGDKKPRPLVRRDQICMSKDVLIIVCSLLGLLAIFILLLLFTLPFLWIRVISTEDDESVASEKPKLPIQEFYQTPPPVDLSRFWANSQPWWRSLGPAALRVASIKRWTFLDRLSRSSRDHVT